MTGMQGNMMVITRKKNMNKNRTENRRKMKNKEKKKQKQRKREPACPPASARLGSSLQRLISQNVSFILSLAIYSADTVLKS